MSETEQIEPTTPSAGPTLHAQQEAAVFHRGSSVGLSAGAGCGKTTVLIERFLHELDPARLSEPGPHGLPAVVAITFTEKATAEMIARVRRGVNARLRDPARLSERKHWREVSRRLDTARISTIHGFCTTLLREHAAAVDLDPAFRTIEGAELEELRAETVDAALKTALARKPKEAGDGEDPADALSPRDLVTRCGLTTVRSTLLALLDADREELERPWSADDLIAARAAGWAGDLIAPGFARLRDSAEWSALRPVIARNLESEPKKAAARAELLSGFDTLFTGSAPEPDVLRTRLSELRPLTLSGALGQSARMWDGDDYALIQAHLKPFRDGVDELRKHLGDEPPDVAAALPVVRAYLPLAAAAGRRYERVKRETARLDFGDQLRLAARLLRDEGVREKAARSIRLLMVDEFQDTDPVQAEIVRRLAGLAIDEDPGKLFLVGDAKQSIYRFRGADPGVFARLRGELPAAGRLPLTKNFRSRPEILRFVNALFDPAMPDYEPLEPPPGAPLDSPGGPHVEFLLPAVPLTGDGKKAGAEACREVEARWIAARVRELLDGGPCVRVKGENERRPVPGDVCLLFRALTDVKLYEDALRGVGIECYLAGGKSFFAQQEVQDLVHLLLWLDDPDDTLSLAGVLRSPLCGLSDDTLFALTDDRPQADGSAVAPAPLTAAVLSDDSFGLSPEQTERLNHARSVLRDLLASRPRLGPGGLLERAVDRFGYDGSVLLEFLGERKLANLRKLLRMARDADAAPDGGLRGFAARLLESVKETLNEDEAATVTQDPNVATLMTVHGAKGLEFPIVVACDLDRQPQSITVKGALDPDLGPIVPLTHQHGEELTDPGAEVWKAREASAEEAEVVRVFYVAATRAADRLILSAARPLKPGKKGQADAVAEPTGVPLKTLDAAFDLADGSPRTPQKHGDPLYVAPSILVHDDKPRGAGKRLPGTRRGTPPGKFAEALAAAEPCERYDLRLPVPPPAPGVRRVDELSLELATEAERTELDALLAAAAGEDADGVLAAARKRLDTALKLPRDAEQRRGLDYLIPSAGDGRPAMAGRIERVDRLPSGWATTGVVPATLAEVAGKRVPDRLAPRLWAEARALAPLGGGANRLLLAAGDGTTRWVSGDGIRGAPVARLLDRLTERSRS